MGGAYISQGLQPNKLTTAKFKFVTGIIVGLGISGWILKDVVQFTHIISQGKIETTVENATNFITSPLSNIDICLIILASVIPSFLSIYIVRIIASIFPKKEIDAIGNFIGKKAIEIMKNQKLLIMSVMERFLHSLSDTLTNRNKVSPYEIEIQKDSEDKQKDSGETPRGDTPKQNEDNNKKT